MLCYASELYSTNVTGACRVTADTVVSTDLIALQQGQWAFGQIGFYPTVQALNFTALQNLCRQQQYQRKPSINSVKDVKDRKLLNVQRFTTAYLSSSSTRVFQQECPSLQPNLNLKLPLDHRLDMVGSKNTIYTTWLLLMIRATQPFPCIQP